MTDLKDLHEALAARYKELLEGGSEDPRILKEVREFLIDNNVTLDSINRDLDDSEVIDLHLDEDLIKLVQNG